jgi:hypothetical protein
MAAKITSSVENISSKERELIRDELAWLADRLISKYKFTVAEAKAAIREILTCSV